MSVWSKIESFGGLISGVGAMIVAVLAIQQSSSNEEQVSQLLEAMAGMERFFEDEKHRARAGELLEVFQENDWEGLDADELYQSAKVASWNLSKQDFVSVLIAGEKSGLLRIVVDRRADPEKPRYTFIWDPALHLN